MAQKKPKMQNEDKAKKRIIQELRVADEIFQELPPAVQSIDVSLGRPS